MSIALLYRWNATGRTKTKIDAFYHANYASARAIFYIDIGDAPAYDDDRSARGVRQATAEVLAS